ncbi:MAG: DUF4920 domain-containing protein [Ignavibacteriales bacterium]|nr:DUF4920 domain-containing protein [Ignavibacteriales bacterium]
MKTKSLLIIFAMLLSNILIAGKGEKYGKDLTLKSKTKISDILADPKKFDGKRVLVEGDVLDVYKEQGCWIKLSGDKDNQNIRFKVDDGVIVFPIEVKGKKAQAEGVLSVKTFTKEEQITQDEHHAKEEGKTFDPSTVKGPKTVIQINGEGAVIDKLRQ